MIAQKSDINKARIYEGINDVKVAFEDILNRVKPGEEYLVFALGNELGSDRRLIKFFQDYHERRVERNIKVRLIANESLQKAFLRHYAFKNLKVKYAKVKLPTGIFIYENTVLSFMPGKRPFAFSIISKEYAQINKAFFEEIWRFALNP